MVTWQLTIDCRDPGRMLAFWSDALDYVVPPPPGGHATWKDHYLSVGVPPEEFAEGVDGADRLVDPAGHGPSLWFQIVPEGKTIKNRLHLDLFVPGDGRPPDEVRAEVARRIDHLVAGGASVLHRHVAGDRLAATLADPEGNEFCVTSR